MNSPEIELENQHAQFLEQPQLYIGRPIDKAIVKDAFSLVNIASGGKVAVYPRREPGITYVSTDELLMLGGSPSRTNEEATAAQIDAVITDLAQEQPERLMLHNKPLEARIGFVLFEEYPNFTRLKLKVYDQQSRELDIRHRFVMTTERAAIRTGLKLPPRPKKYSKRETPTYMAKIGLTSKSRTFNFIECAKFIKNQHRDDGKVGGIGTLKI